MYNLILSGVVHGAFFCFCYERDSPGMRSSHSTRSPSDATAWKHRVRSPHGPVSGPIRWSEPGPARPIRLCCATLPHSMSPVPRSSAHHTRPCGGSLRPCCDAEALRCDVISRPKSDLQRYNQGFVLQGLAISGWICVSVLHHEHANAQRRDRRMSWGGLVGSTALVHR